MKKKVLITGVTGQDGSFLAEKCLREGYRVCGLVRRLSNQNYQNIRHILDQIELHYGDMLDTQSLESVVEKIKPNEVYNLAAQSSPGESFRQPFYTTDVVGLGAHRLMEVVFKTCPEAKFYQASSSEMFGWTKESPQDEDTQFNPANPYACAKLYAHTIARIYRSKGCFVSCGILFNHESERRGLQFVTQKIAYGAACAALRIKTSQALNEENEPIVKDGKIALGNLKAIRDWGYAPDYVEAMSSMLGKKPGEWVVATGEGHTVEDFCREAYGVVGLDFKKYIYVDQRFVRPTETGPLIGVSKKIKKELGWKPKTSFKELVKKMVDFNMVRLK